MNLFQIAAQGYKPQPQELRPFNTVLKNQRNQLDVVTGPTFQQIELVTNITDPSKITSVQVELNGQAIVDVTGSDLVKLAAYKKISRDAGRYIIPFANAEALTIEGRRLGELVTLPTDNLTVFVTIGDTGSTSITMRARALVTPAQRVRKAIPKLDAVNVNAPSSGENLYDWKLRNQNLQIRRLHLQAADITKLKVFRDDLKVFEARADDNVADLKEGGKRAPQAGWFTFDPSYTGYLAQGLFMTIANRELSFKFDKTAHGNVRVLRETLEQVAPIGQAA